LFRFVELPKEATMKLTIQTFGGSPFNGRRRCFADIVDEDTGKKVGYMRAGGVGFGGSGGIFISLSGEKYCKYFNRFEECYGFMKGVEAALNYTQHHLTSTEYLTTVKEVA
jgi:hypothetical protein